MDAVVCMLDTIDELSLLDIEAVNLVSILVAS